MVKEPELVSKEELDKIIEELYAELDTRIQELHNTMITIIYRLEELTIRIEKIEQELKNMRRWEKMSNIERKIREIIEYIYDTVDYKTFNDVIDEIEGKIITLENDIIAIYDELKEIRNDLDEIKRKIKGGNNE